MKCLTLSCILLTATTAWPNGTPAPTPTTSGPSAESDSSSNAMSNSNATSTSNSNASQTQYASGSATATASNQGNTQGVSINETHPRNAPSVIAPSVYPTANCQGGVSLGGSGVNGGGLVGFSYQQRECATVVLAQNFASLGMIKEACEVLLTTETAKRAYKGREFPACTQPASPETSIATTPVTVVVPSGDYATKDYVDRAFKKSVSK